MHKAVHYLQRAHLLQELTNVLIVKEAVTGQSVDPTILSFNYTCLAQGDSIDQYRSLAVVVVYEESGSVEDLQFQLQCSSFNNVGSWELFGPESTPPAGFRSLNTRTDCSSCPSTANNDHKCARESPSTHCRFNICSASFNTSLAVLYIIPSTCLMCIKPLALYYAHQCLQGH